MTDEKQSLAKLTLTLPTARSARAAVLGDLVNEITFLAATTIGKEIRALTKLAATVDKSFDTWTDHRPRVRAAQEAFAAYLTAALVEGDEGLTRQAAAYPLQSEAFEIIESEVTSPNGQVSRMLQRKPKPQAAAPITLTIPGVPR
jgi:hypothetical protein